MVWSEKELRPAPLAMTDGRLHSCSVLIDGERCRFIVGEPISYEKNLAVDYGAPKNK
jgi:hypothetical protein